AGYSEAVAEWVAETRMALARTLAEVLGSAEATMVVTEQAETAAAAIGARVLATIATAYDKVDALLARWRPALEELPDQPPAEERAALTAGLRIGRGSAADRPLRN